jgi:hypothetical protein
MKLQRYRFEWHKAANRFLGFRWNRYFSGQVYCISAGFVWWEVSCWLDFRVSVLGSILGRRA